MLTETKIINKINKINETRKIKSFPQLFSIKRFPLEINIKKQIHNVKKIKFHLNKSNPKI